jgi:hypothetical protein
VHWCIDLIAVSDPAVVLLNELIRTFFTLRFFLLTVSSHVQVIGGVQGKVIFKHISRYIFLLKIESINIQNNLLNNFGK